MTARPSHLSTTSENDEEPRTSTKHLLRLRRVLNVVSAGLVIVGFFWGVYFALRDEWSLAGFDGVLVAVGAWVALLNERGELRRASLVVAIGLFLTLCTMGIFFDIPSANAPRVVHQYLLVLGMASFLMFKGESAWLCHGVPLICFSAFFLFASTQWGIVTPFALPDSVRIVGSWVNSGIALVIMYAMLYVMQSDMAEYNAMIVDLRHGLRDNQFALHYQPQTGPDGLIAGAEALLRWKHPLTGMVPPAEFIPLAEETGFILPLGHWVLGAACAQLVVWAQKPDMAHLTLAVNVSAQEFRQADYVTQVLSVLERSGANPARLKLELTESMLVNNVEDIITKMTELRAKGVRLSLDDFGTGYSSLTYLKRLPLDQIKIDKSFVNDVLTNPHDAAIARTVVTLGQSMGLEVIAEGVETQGQRDFLANLGCHAIQGYLISRPLPMADFEAFVAKSGCAV